MSNRKYIKKYLMPKIFDPKDHPWVGIVWPVEGSTGNQYSVELTDKGFECDCRGFSYHGYCKHSRKVLAKVEKAVA
tara:strand:+ start:131 stop:358 length:228 start_codon:yes stop_codon:yes gene_type:complete